MFLVERRTSLFWIERGQRRIGRLREPSLQALLRELAAFNAGLCVITTRLAVADLADHEGISAPRRELEQLSSDAGAKLLRGLGVKGAEADLRTASDEFGGHGLALTLLGSYLSDAYNGDIRCREEVSTRLAHDVRQGAHARKVMESYETWFAEGPELSVLRMLGLFDRPADEKALGILLKAPSIRGVAEPLVDLELTERRAILARLRRAGLLAGEDPHNPGHLDTHPLVREYFGKQLRTQRTEAWKECNKRLYDLALKAEALHIADHTSESLEAISEAEALVERFEDRHWCAELHRLRGLFLATLGAEETQIEASFCAAIKTAREQKSVSLEKRAEATHAEYRRQKASGSGGSGFRLPLC
jgi:hypothetical protein